MLFLIRNIVLLLIFTITFTRLFAADIPVIVIAPSKKAQSISTVGSSVVIYDAKAIENSTDYFLGDVLNFGSPIPKNCDFEFILVLVDAFKLKKEATFGK